MNGLFAAGVEYISAVYWAQECEKYANSHVIGKRWRLSDGDVEAIRIMQQAQNDERVAFHNMEVVLKNA